MRSIPSRLCKTWEKFWFLPMDPLPLGLFRFFFGLNLFLMYGLRHFSLDRFFTDNGLVTSEAARGIVHDFYKPFLDLTPIVNFNPWLAHSVFLFLILCLMFGVFGRIAAVLALVLHLAFVQRNIAIVYGADIVTSFWLLYLCLGESDRAFSLRAWWKSRNGKVLAPAGWFSSALSTTSVRLIQIQLCIIYGYTGLEKLKGTPWWDGSAVWAVFGNTQLMVADLSFMRGFPIIVGLMTHFTVLFEVYFPALIWFRPIRNWVLIAGLLLHLGIAAGMGLYFFSGAMLAAYFVFLPPDLIRDRIRCFKSRVF